MILQKQVSLNKKFTATLLPSSGNIGTSQSAGATVYVSDQNFMILEYADVRTLAESSELDLLFDTHIRSRYEAYCICLPSSMETVE